MNLSTAEKETFYRLLHGLQFFAADKLGIDVGATSAKEYAALDVESKVPVRNAVYDSPELMLEYADQNPDGFSDAELATVRGWRRFVRGRFLVERHLKKHSIWILDDVVYAVHGITQPLEEIIPKFAIPIMVEAVLLPFQGRIVFDGCFFPLNISFGGGIKRSLRETYMRAKQNERIVESLDQLDEVEPTQSKVPWAPSRRWTKQLTAMDKAVAALKGEKHPINRAAIGLLKASSLLVRTALENAEGAELDDLTDRHNQAVKELGRLRRALERSE